MKQVVILSGVSGSGKSGTARSYQERFPVCRIVSADHYFMKDGEYRFDPKLLGAAHAACFREFILALLDDSYGSVVVDNTNTTVTAISPYVLGARAFGFEPEIVTIMCADLHDVQAAADRNQHKVPFSSCLKQYQQLTNRCLPSDWKSSTFLMQR